ncbi:MAG TPA: YciI family protein [Micromonosporaceae bacterium]
MKYLMLVCIDRPTDAVRRDLGRAVGPAPDEIDVEAWVDEMDGRGARLLGERIRPERDSTTVRVRDNKVLLTDGPYAETKDLVAGFDVLECADLDEAVAIAAKHPMARDGVLELRPFWTG